MPSTKPMFFECFLACRSGPETRSSHQILTIYPACTLPKHAWNTILSTKSLLFARFGIPRSAWNAKLSSNSYILSRLHPAQTTLKHDAVDKIIVFMFLMRQNHPERRISRQIQQLYQFRSLSKQAWNRMLLTKTTCFHSFWWVKISLKRSSRQIQQLYQFRSLSKQA